jgi:hypothetical protein
VKLDLHGAIAMDKRIALALVVAVCAVGSTAYAVYGVTDSGTWPRTWPAELESLRKQSRTLEGPEAPDRHYAIRFTKREEFEAAWPHIVKVKRKGAPLLLKRAPNFFLDGKNKAGVVVHCPPLRGADAAGTQEAPTPGTAHEEVRGRDAISLELVVDGEIVDLNRIRLPADTPIIDERFNDGPAEEHPKGR